MFKHCKSRSDFLKKIIELENLLSPIEFLNLSQENPNIPDIAKNQIASTLNMMQAIDKKIHPFSRREISKNVNFYSYHPTEGGGIKKLLICFCGLANRLLVPIPTFLQCIPASEFDVLVYIDPSAFCYMQGVPEFSTSIKNLTLDTQKYINFNDYKSLISLGTSGGGSAAIYFGILIKASSAISICGKHRTLSLHKAHIIEASLDGFEFDRMIEDLLELSKTKLLLVCGEGCQKDIEGAQTLKKYLAKSRTLLIRDLDSHNVIMFLLGKKKLTHFIHGLLNESFFE
jgi:hypothetical protein